jgi:hypothetical protein
VQGDAKFMSIAAASVLAKPIATNIKFMRIPYVQLEKNRVIHQKTSRSYKKIWGDKIPSNEFSIVAGTVLF